MTDDVVAVAAVVSQSFHSQERIPGYRIPLTDVLTAVAVKK